MNGSPERARPAEDPADWGFSDEELARHPTVFAPGLLDGKVVVISGGGTGLGKAMTFLMTRLGAQVVICGRREAKLAATAQSVKDRLGGRVDYEAMTIRDPEAVEKFLRETRETHGRIDVLINNGGGQFPQAAIDFSVKGWHAVIDTNLNGSWYMMQNAARLWRDHDDSGCIINIVANVWRGMPQVAHTCAARAGVIYLSKTLSTEWAPLGIRVNCISPGSIETEGFEVYPDGAADRFKDSNPMRRTGDAWDIAEAAVYLAAPSGKFITGEVLVVDGGNQQWGAVWPDGKPDYFKTD
ncbi:SDR family oxidoreductase [Elongatibacter sediminis]|uniref:Peroxisomal trans-2-enoyl-CoA reductase n=1 Tax=Elongatibacter sediminis TaxID=3119006 RepID=A0AAW9RBK3_9GAMM